MEKSYRPQIDTLKRIRHTLEELDPPEVLEELRKKLARSRAAAAERPDDTLLSVLPSDVTPSGALRRYVGYCAAARTEDAMSLCHMDGPRDRALAVAIISCRMTQAYLHACCTLHFGEEAT